MPENRVQVTYAAPSHLQSSDQWTQLQAGLTAQLPLRNLHWKPATRVSVRTIQVLDVTLVPFESVKEENVSQIPTSLLEKPLLNLYVVTCEDNEAYKNTVKRQIKEWHSVVTQRRNQEWLLIFVVRPDARATSTGILKMRGTMLDRIKADFNVDKRDRCVQLTWSDDNNDPAVWVETMTKLKEGITSAFDAAVAQREEDVKRSEGQKLMPGWNFCTFFILKESLASSFEGMNLLDDALIQYDELEAAFFQVLKDRNLSWFGKLVDIGPKDDSLPLLSATKKPYRDLILANTISVFDFRIYLLARQCSLLGRMGRVAVISRKVVLFLGAFGKRLREIQDELPTFFIESWIYSSATSAVEKCDEWASRRDVINGNAEPGSSAAKGELLEVALNQLDRIGIVLEYLPTQAPFYSCTADDTALVPKGSRSITTQAITNSDLLSLMKNKPAFYDHYIRLTNKAIDLYVKAGRRKFALKLHGRIASLDAFRGRNLPALQTYMSLPAHYSPHRWCDLEAYALINSLESHKSMGSSNDREWLHTAMAFLKTYVVGIKKDILVGVVDVEAYTAKLVEGVCQAAAHLQSDLTIQNHPLFAVHVLKNTCRIAGRQDGYLLDIEICNELPTAFSVEDISLVASGRNSRTVHFKAESTTFERGRSRKPLVCTLPLSGLFSIELLEVRIGRLILQWSLGARNAGIDAVASSSRLVRLPKDENALDVEVRQPQRVRYGEEKELLVVLMPGRNTLHHAFLKFASSDVRVFMEKCKHIDSHASVEFGSEEITVIPGTSDKISFLLPYVSLSNVDRATINVNIEYSTSTEPTTIRSFSISKQVNITQYLTVNVTDHFRGDRLFSSFTVSTTSNQHIYVHSADLVSSKDDGSEVSVMCPNRTRRRTIVTPSQPARFMFQLTSESEALHHQLVFCVTYSLLREEVEEVVAEAVASQADTPSNLRESIRNAVIRALETDASWVQVYEGTGEIHVQDVHQVEEDIAEFYSKVKKRLRERSFEGDSRIVWREAVMTLDVPRIDIIAAARIRLVPASEGSQWRVHSSNSFFAGQPIRAILSIHVSFRWSGQEARDSEFRLRFNVEEMLKHWLISGQRQGEFVAKDGCTFNVPLTIMALRHGELALPQVQLSALSTPSANGMKHTLVPTLECYQEHGAERVTVFPRGSRTTFMFEMTRDS